MRPVRMGLRVRVRGRFETKYVGEECIITPSSTPLIANPPLLRHFLESILLHLFVIGSYNTTAFWFNARFKTSISISALVSISLMTSS